MENRKLEDKIKSVIESSQPVLDHDEIWNKIEPKLKKQKRRRFIVFWFLLGVCGLAVYGLSKSLNIQYANEAFNMALPSLTDPAYNEDTEAEDTEVERTHEEETVLPLTGKELLLQNRVEKSDQKSNKQGKSVEYTDQMVVSNEQGDVTAERVQNQKMVPAQIAESDRNESFSSTSLIDNEGIKNNIKTSNNTPATIDGNELINDNRMDDVAISLDEKLSEISNGNLSKETHQEESQTKNNTGNSNEKETAKPSSTEEKKSKVEFENKSNEKKPIEIKKKWRPRGRWVFEIQPFVAPIWAINSIKSNSREVAASYIDNRKESESTLEAYAGGVNVRLSNSERKFIALAGIQYRRLNQRFDQTTTTTETRTITGPVAVVEDAQGEIIETELGQKTEISTTVSKFRTFNHYTYFSVPIGIGTKWVERNYSMAVMAGIDYNLSFKLNGSMLDTDGNTISFKDGANKAYYNEVFKKRSGIDFWITAEYARKINRDVYWTVAPKIQFPTGNIHKNEFGASQRFYLFGLDLGVIYLLN